MERNAPHGDRTRDQLDRARMGQLLRAVLPVDVGQVTQTHRRVSGALGLAKVQTTTGTPQASMGVSGRRGNTRAQALCSLASSTPRRPNGGSRMNGDGHVRFCESLGLQCPGPLDYVTRRQVRQAEVEGEDQSQEIQVRPEGRPMTILKRLLLTVPFVFVFLYPLRLLLPKRPARNGRSSRSPTRPTSSPATGMAPMRSW